MGAGEVCLVGGGGMVRGRLFTTGRHSGTSLTMSRPLAGARWACCWLLKVQAPMLRTPPTTRPVPPTSPPPALGPTNGGAGGRSGECGPLHGAAGHLPRVETSSHSTGLGGGHYCSAQLATYPLCFDPENIFSYPLIFWLLVVVNIFAKYFMQRLLFLSQISKSS